MSMANFTNDYMPPLPSTSHIVDLTSDVPLYIMELSDLRFDNVQLTKLVTSAEVLFQHLYDLVSCESKNFIDQWLNFKREYVNACTNDEKFDMNENVDVNENVQECPVLSRIDEVSENERVSSTSSVSTGVSTHSEKTDYLNESSNSFSSKEDTKDITDTTKESVNLLQLDIDLLDYMNDFKLLTDGTVNEWFKTLCFNTAEIKQYMNWLESKDYNRIWTDIYANAHRKSDLNNVKYNGFENMVKQVEENTHNRFIPIDTSSDHSAEISNVLRGNSTNHLSNVNLQYNPHREELIDQHIRYLQDVRRTLMCLKQEANPKFKNKDGLYSSSDYHSFLKMDVAFEIIDLSIEMKNQLKLGHELQDLATVNDKVDKVIDDCLRVLTLTEARYLIFTYLNNVTTMRKCSSEHDKQVSELDREISNQKFLIWRLYMIINENKRSYESRCLTLHKEFEQKLQLMGKTTTDESNDESMTGVPKRELLPIMERNSLQESTQSESKDVQNALSCVPHIPEKNLRILQSTSASPLSTKVKRNKKKLIIMAQK